LNEKKRTLEDFVADSVVVVEASESANGLAKGKQAEGAGLPATRPS